MNRNRSRSNSQIRAMGLSRPSRRSRRRSSSSSSMNVGRQRGPEVGDAAAPPFQQLSSLWRLGMTPKETLCWFVVRFQ